MKNLLRKFLTWFNRPKIVVKNVDNSSVVIVKIDGKEIINTKTKK